MNGVIIVDKPAGKSSYDAVRQVRKLLGAKKAGHTGTLDPLATGVLPICLNEATKLVQFLVTDSKDYHARMLLGVETDTLDIEGKVIESNEISLREEDVATVLKSFLGKIVQTPPVYSAVKHKGKALYSWARKGISVAPTPRAVEVSRIKLLEFEPPYVTFFVSCSKGTYIRSLCADIGERLGCKACLAGLRRLRSGRFHEREALSLESLGRCGADGIGGRLISMADALSDFPDISVDEGLAIRLRDGHQPTIQDLAWNNMPSLAAGDMVRFTVNPGGLVAVGTVLYDSEARPSLISADKFIRIARVFNA